MTVRRTAGAVIAGWHQEPVVKRTEESSRSMLQRVVAAALADAGLRAGDVDGLAVSGFTLAPDTAVDLAAACGLRPGWLASAEPGGSGGLGALAAACDVVRSGTASVVVCAAADRTDTASLAGINAGFNSVFAGALEPIGAAAANIVFGLLQEQYFDRHGLTRADLAHVAVAQRANAAANERALFRDPLTVDGYLDARPVAEPVHLFDCVLPACGAAAIVVCSAEAAARLGARARVHVRAMHSSYVPHRRDASDLTAMGWAAEADALFAEAGLDRADVDGAQLYDDYPLMVAIQLEELGFAAPGRGPALARDAGFGVAAALPVNTGGGMLNCGQPGGAGGYLPLIEALDQLDGRFAGVEGRQIPGARTQVVSALGMIDDLGPQSFVTALLSLDPAPDGARGVSATSRAGSATADSAAGSPARSTDPMDDDGDDNGNAGHHGDRITVFPQGSATGGPSGSAGAVDPAATPALPRCTSCGRWAWPELVRCRACAGDVAPVELRGTGTVRASVRVHRGVLPQHLADGPYVLVLLDLPEGIRFVTRYVADVVHEGGGAGAGEPGPRPAIGTQVRLEVRMLADGTPWPLAVGGA